MRYEHTDMPEHCPKCGEGVAMVWSDYGGHILEVYCDTCTWHLDVGKVLGLYSSEWKPLVDKNYLHELREMGELKANRMKIIFQLDKSGEKCAEITVDPQTIRSLREMIPAMSAMIAGVVDEGNFQYEMNCQTDDNPVVRKQMERIDALQDTLKAMEHVFDALLINNEDSRSEFRGHIMEFEKYPDCLTYLRGCKFFSEDESI